jgi:uncharacterized membrane protein YdjX (TVP38/TMEM64 family)
LNTGKDTRISGDRKNHIYIKLSLFLFLVGGLTVLVYHLDLIRLFFNKEHLLHFLDSFGPWASVVFVLLQAFQVVAAPIPGEVTGILGGYLYGPFLGILLSTIGLTIGSYVAFILARCLGRPFVERYVAPSTIARFDYLLHHKGVFLVFLLFLLPGFPKDALCYLLGLGHLSTIEFLVIGGVGRLLGTILLTLEGNFLRLHQYGMFYTFVAFGLIILLLALAYKDKLERKFRQWYRKKDLKEIAKPLDNPE